VLFYEGLLPLTPIGLKEQLGVGGGPIQATRVCMPVGRPGIRVMRMRMRTFKKKNVVPTPGIHDATLSTSATFSRSDVLNILDVPSSKCHNSARNTESEI
jgi:hypothetical protein